LASLDDQWLSQALQAAVETWLEWDCLSEKQLNKLIWCIYPLATLSSPQPLKMGQYYSLTGNICAPTVLDG
jgi:hypothetical protein